MNDRILNVPVLPFVLLLATSCQHTKLTAPKIADRQSVIAVSPTRLASAPEASNSIEATPMVIPQPKYMKLSGKTFGLNAQTRLVIANGATARDKAAAFAFNEELAERYGISGLRIVRAASVKRPQNVIVFGEPGRGRLVAKLLKISGAVPPTRAEGYVLRFGPTWAVVAGHDPAGTFYGAQTIRQLIVRDRSGVGVREAVIDDYPSLTWRGAHLFVGDHALQFHRALIGNVLSRLKMNNLVLECEHARWDTTRASTPPWAMSKSDLRQEVKFARDHFMEPTPLVESVGHMAWLFADPKQFGLAEDPRTPYALSPDNPATYRLMFRLYDEVIDLFHPAYLHVGADEVTMRGRYPFLSASAYPTFADAFTVQINTLHDYLKSKGVGTMIWGDMLLGPKEAPDSTNAPSLAEAAQMRRGLRKDIVIADWHYGTDGKFNSPHLFREAGFAKVIGATWYDPRNIAVFSQAQTADHQLGLLQTTWAGYDSSAKNLKSDPQQFAAFVLAADAAWTGGQIDPKHVRYNAAKVFADWYAPTRRGSLRR